MSFFRRVTSCLPRIVCAAALAGTLVACQAQPYVSTTATLPPPLIREFRAAWIPTVGNSCWPSKSGLSTSQQKAELLALLDRAAELKLNAVIFQVRPACDALFKSQLEPWSEYLTGRQGQAPSPYYDPLEFAVTEAHKRGLELHAWFNPYRARHQNARSPIATNHITKLRPGLTRTYGNYLWLDPGEPDVQSHALHVVLDVVRRYDIDAVHFDDYFYPYPEKSTSGADLGFPDDSSWQKYGANSGLSRADWRRRNVDTFIQRINRSIHAEKPWMKFGLSPFGIWRPKHPPTIQGLDAYDKLYADARKWLQEGWCDYVAPQLYWGFEPSRTSFPVLLKWWDEQNLKQRHLWPGINSYATIDPNPEKLWPVSEIARQITLMRKSGVSGEIHWSHSALMKNEALRHKLETEFYQQPAVIPAFRWLDSTPPGKPKLTAQVQGNNSTFIWSTPDTNAPALWVLQSRQFSDWKTQILPANSTRHTFHMKPDLVAVIAVDRCGNTSQPAVLKQAK
jgi:uncharacterized lipoprotein YddW (UPF0748 family)